MMQTATGTLALVASVSTRSARAFAVVSRSIGFIFPEGFGAAVAQLARELAELVSEPVLDIARLLEAAFGEGLDAVLRGGPAERRDAGLPSRTKAVQRYEIATRLPSLSIPARAAR